MSDPYRDAADAEETSPLDQRDRYLLKRRSSLWQRGKVRRDLAGGVARIEVRQDVAGSWRTRVGPNSGIELGRELISSNPDRVAAQLLLLEDLCGLDPENRYGQMSQRQKRRLRRSALPELFIAGVFGAMIPAFRRSGMDLFMTVLFVAVGCFFLSRVGRQLADAFIGQIKWVDGMVDKGREYRGKAGHASYLDVGGLRIWISDEIYERLTVLDSPLRVGYSPRSRRLVAIQPSLSTAAGGVP